MCYSFYWASAYDTPSNSEKKMNNTIKRSI